MENINYKDLLRFSKGEEFFYNCVGLNNTVAICIDKECRLIGLLDGNFTLHISAYYQNSIKKLFGTRPYERDESPRSEWARIPLGAGDIIFMRTELKKPVLSYLREKYGIASAAQLSQHWCEAIIMCLYNAGPCGLNGYMCGVYRKGKSPLDEYTYLDKVNKEPWRDWECPEELRELLDHWQKEAYKKVAKWYSLYPVKLVRIEFSYKGKQYKIEPSDFNLPDPLAEIVNIKMAKDLEKLGCEDVRDIGFLD